MVSVGGARSHQTRVAPNILFLIDTTLSHHVNSEPPRLTMNDQEARLAALKLKRTLLRIMLMFHSQEAQPIQWAFQFFDSTAPQEIGTLNNRRFQEFNKAGINNCMDEFLQRLTTPRHAAMSISSVPMARTLSGSGGAQPPMALPSPCVNIRTQLVHSLSDFAWTASSSFQSPIKPSGGVSSGTSWKSQLHKNPPPIPVKNYMFLVSPLPHSWQDLECFGDATKATAAYHHHQRPAGSMMAAGPRTSEFVDLLTHIKNAFFDQGPWERFVDQHLSLSWIDTRSEDCVHPPQLKTRTTTATVIRKTFQLIVNAFGGHIIPFHILHATLAPPDLYSFSTIFMPYKPTFIHPSIGLKLARPGWTPFTMNEMEVVNPIAHIPETSWRCDLVSQSKSQVLCELDLADSDSMRQKEGTKGGSALTDITLLESVVAIKRIPQCAFNKALLAQAIMTKQYPISRSQILCQPMRELPDQRLIHLLHSLYDKRDVLLLELHVEEEGNYDQENIAQAKNGSTGSNAFSKEEEHMQNIVIVPAALVATVRGSGIIQVLEKPVGDVLLRNVSTLSSSHMNCCNSTTRPQTASTSQAFSLAMIEQALASVGVFAERIPEEDNNDRWNTAMEKPYTFAKAPIDYWAAPTTTSNANGDGTKAGEEDEDSDKDVDDPQAGIAAIESIDALNLSIRAAYIKHLYENGCSLTDFTTKIIATSKEAQSLASRQSIPIKEAMQALVNFIIQFLRISPAKLDSKYKQLSKELHISKKMADTAKTTTAENYAILQDERPALDKWKARVMTSVQDEELRSDLKALKTKDIQIQIVQNLLILNLIKKYELEEIKPFKRDPNATKTTLTYMDRLCIAASIDGTDKKSARLLRSPETPRSKDMDPAKRFFTRVIKRFFGASLPSIVKMLATKCGAELSSSLLTSPRPNRTKWGPMGGMARSLSMGVLPRSTGNPLLKSPSAKRVRDVLKSSRFKDKTGTMAGATTGKEGATTSLISDKSKSSVLNNPIFRNRQVTMPRSTLKSSSAAVSTTQPLAMPRSQSQSSLDMLAASASKKDAVEDEVVPQVAKLKLKKFYHDKESEEVLKLFRRKGPLSKADALLSSTNTQASVFSMDNTDSKQKPSGQQQQHLDSGEDDDDDDISTLRGTTSWGVIKSGSTPRAHHRHYQTPSSSSLPADFAQFPSADDPLAPLPDSPSSNSIVPATPQSKHKTASFSSLPILHHSLADLDEGEESERGEQEDEGLAIPRTPTRRQRGFLRRALTDVNGQWLHPGRTSPSGAIKVAGTPVGPGPSTEIDDTTGGGAPRTPTRGHRYNRQRRESIQSGLSFAAQIRGSPVSASTPWLSPGGLTGSSGSSVSSFNSGWPSPLSKKWGSRLQSVSVGSNSGTSATSSMTSSSSASSSQAGDTCDRDVEDYDDDEVVRSPMKRHISRLLSIQDTPSSSGPSTSSLRKGLLFGGSSSISGGTQMAKRIRTEP